jgi:hypothetical protein
MEEVLTGETRPVSRSLSGVLPTAGAIGLELAVDPNAGISPAELAAAIVRTVDLPRSGLSCPARLLPVIMNSGS